LNQLLLRALNGVVESKVNAGPTVLMELDGATIQLLTPVPLNLIAMKMMNVLEIVNGMVHQSL
jgi:molybdenum cofactor biosynthesis enzyme MoaA